MEWRVEGTIGKEKRPLLVEKAFHFLRCLNSIKLICALA